MGMEQGLGGDLERWLTPFLEVVGRKTRRTWTPLGVVQNRVTREAGGAAGMGGGTLGLSTVVRVWTEVLARRPGCPRATARTWPSRRWPVQRPSAAWPPGTGSAASSSTSRRTRPALRWMRPSVDRRAKGVHPHFWCSQAG